MDTKRRRKTSGLHSYTWAWKLDSFAKTCKFEQEVVFFFFGIYYVLLLFLFLFFKKIDPKLAGLMPSGCNMKLVGLFFLEKIARNFSNL